MRDIGLFRSSGSAFRIPARPGALGDVREAAPEGERHELSRSFLAADATDHEGPEAAERRRAPGSQIAHDVVIEAGAVEGSHRIRYGHARRDLAEVVAVDVPEAARLGSLHRGADLALGEGALADVAKEHVGR